MLVQALGWAVWLLAAAAATLTPVAPAAAQAVEERPFPGGITAHNDPFSPAVHFHTPVASEDRPGVTVISSLAAARAKSPPDRAAFALDASFVYSAAAARRYDYATLPGGIAVELELRERSTDSCDGTRCTHFEAYRAHLDPLYLPTARRKGLSLKFFPLHGAAPGEVVTVPAGQVDALLAAVEQGWSERDPAP